MSEAIAAPAARWRARVIRLVLVALVIAAIAIVTYLLGWDIRSWFHDLWHEMTSITLAGTFIYLYLFLSVPGSFNIELGNISAHKVLTALIILGAVFLLVVLVRILWRKMKGLWEKAKVGGKILEYPRVYFSRVFFSQFLSWSCKLGVIGIFLAAYGIPVTFHTIMSVAGGNSLANVASFTPGAVGITQAVNTASLTNVTDATTAAAYSLGQQLIVTAWNQIFAITLLIWTFGWTGGKQLVRTSYSEAKDKVAEQQEARKARKGAKRAESA